MTTREGLNLLLDQLEDQLPEGCHPIPALISVAIMTLVACHDNEKSIDGHNPRDLALFSSAIEALIELGHLTPNAGLGLAPKVTVH